jgi:hypothetical protein
MTSLSQPDHIIIRELVNNAVGNLCKNHFRLFQVSPVIWNYVSYNTGGIYRLYTNSPDKSCFSNLECTRQACIYDQDFLSAHDSLHNIIQNDKNIKQDNLYNSVLLEMK